MDREPDRPDGDWIREAKATFGSDDEEARRLVAKARGRDDDSDNRR
jgi:hypothetical protein